MEGAINTTQSTNESILKDEASGSKLKDVAHGSMDPCMFYDEGYQSALDCTACKHVGNVLLELEEFYETQIKSLKDEIDVKNEYIETKKYELEHEWFEKEMAAKGKGGKGYVEKTFDLKDEEVAFKEQYLSTIKSEKKYLRFQQLDDETQLMICKIDALRRSGYNSDFFDALLKMFEGKSMKLQKLMKTVEEMKESEAEYTQWINKLMKQHQRAIEEKDHEINCLKKKLHASLIEKRRGGNLSEQSMIKAGSKHLKIEELDEECQMMIANIEALRESDKMIQDKESIKHA